MVDKFSIIVRTKYQEIIDRFLESFIPTTKKHNVDLYIVHRPEDGIKFKVSNRVFSVPSKSLGNPAYMPILDKVLTKARIKADNKRYGFFGIYNDDLIFWEGWLETVLNGLGYYDCVTPGYINTTEISKLKEAVEKTKNAQGVVKYAIGSCMTWRINVFPKIGTLDTRFDWSCDDLDLIWRMELNGLKSVTLKKITIAHAHGASRVREMKRWNMETKKGKKLFKEKHGIVPYRQIFKDYSGHNYFTKELWR